MRFSWSRGPSPRQPTVVWPRREAPPTDCASGAKQRRYTAASLSSPCFLLMLAVVDNFEFRDYQVLFFDLKSDDLGHRILKSKKIRSDLAYSDCILVSRLQSKHTNLKLQTEPRSKQPRRRPDKQQHHENFTSSPKSGFPQYLLAHRNWKNIYSSRVHDVGRII